MNDELFVCVNNGLLYRGRQAVGEGIVELFRRDAARYGAEGENKAVMRAFLEGSPMRAGDRLNLVAPIGVYKVENA